MIRLACLAAAVLLATPAHAAVIGQMTPAPPLTRERVAEVPDRAAWSAYLDRSDAARRLNDAALATTGPAPPSGDAAASMPLDRPAAWYASAEARHVADVIVSFQTPAGGWGKNAPRSGALRQPGQPFSAEKDYVGTLDNDATVTELRFLARVIVAGGGGSYRDSFGRGVRWLLAAQYPNGGWPQVWPLVGGYHDAVTFNDGAMLAALDLLGDVAAGRGDYAFVDARLRAEADAAWRRGLAWLLTLPEPSPQAQRAIRAAAAWLSTSAIRDRAWPPPGAARRLMDQPGAPLIWARFCDLTTGRPIFGDRDRTIHDDVDDLSAERRNGYAWYGSGPAKALAKYEAWARSHPKP